jgi:hypothetical protein
MKKLFLICLVSVVALVSLRYFGIFTNIPEVDNSISSFISAFSLE